MRSDAEARIYELLNLKIDELLDLGKFIRLFNNVLQKKRKRFQINLIFEENFNWLVQDIKGQASDYMKSLLSFLKSNLDSFNHLPVSSKKEYQKITNQTKIK